MSLIPPLNGTMLCYYELFLIEISTKSIEWKCKHNIVFTLSGVYVTEATINVKFD